MDMVDSMRGIESAKVIGSHFSTYQLHFIKTTATKTRRGWQEKSPISRQELDSGYMPDYHSHKKVATYHRYPISIEENMIA
jgi:trehalose-6-phosphate synthase